MVVKTAIKTIECIDLVTSSRVGSHLKSQLIRSDWEWDCLTKRDIFWVMMCGSDHLFAYWGGSRASSAVPVNDGESWMEEINEDGDVNVMEVDYPDWLVRDFI